MNRWGAVHLDRPKLDEASPTTMSPGPLLGGYLPLIAIVGVVGGASYLIDRSIQKAAIMGGAAAGASFISSKYL